jgi:hypothetical protein
MDMVALGEPGTPLIFWARAGNHQKPEITTITRDRNPARIGWKRSGRRRSIRDFRFLNMVFISQSGKIRSYNNVMEENKQIIRGENIKCLFYGENKPFLALVFFLLT